MERELEVNGGLLDQRRSEIFEASPSPLVFLRNDVDRFDLIGLLRFIM